MSEEGKESLWQRISRNLRYCISGVWEDSRSLWSVKTLKVINMSVHAYLNRDLQMRACALTYRTVLAIVPALAMLFAIARGFGFQNLMQSQLFSYFPAQREAIESALTYVENYLAQTSQGIFIGIGLVFLVWTLVSLMSNVEDTFNHLWGVKTMRSMQRKFTDYTALFLLLPVLMVCSAGISIFLSDTVQRVFGDHAISPLLHRLLSFMPLVISWLIFTAAFYLIPNTKVRFKGALMAGILCGTLFEVLEWLFVSGQVYVSKYNAIYGSFAFLPLLLVWMQLSWLLTLTGVVLTYSWQNFDNFAHRNMAKDVSQTYANRVAVGVLALAAKRFKAHEPALTHEEIVKDCGIPGPLADELLDRLQRANLLTAIAQGKDTGMTAYHPAFDPDELLLNQVMQELSDLGSTDLITKTDTPISGLLKRLDTLDTQSEPLPETPLLELLD